MTLVQAESEAKPRRRTRFRGRRLALAGIAALTISAAAITAYQHFGFGVSESKFKQALAALDRGDWSLVRRCARELKASQPTSPQAAFLRGAMLLERGDFYPALDELEKARQEATLETAALTLMGQAWYRLGRRLEAQAALEEALKADPDSIEAHRWLAALYYDQGVIPRAVFHLRRTSELDPTDPRPDRLLGLMHKDFEQFGEAIPFYQESLRRRSDQQDADEIRQELALCQIKARRYRDALATLAKCSDQLAVDVHRAECLHALGQIPAAKASLARALKVEPDHLDGLLLQGTMLLEDDEPRQAIVSLERAAKAHPQDYTAHFRLAQAYASVGDEKQAAIEHIAAEKLRVVRHEFAQLHKVAGDRPQDIQVRLRLAALAQELGRPDLAEVWLQSAAALRPLAGSKEK